MSRVTIIGSGNVGANTAFFIAERGISDVTLYDIQEGVSRGKALDIMEASPIRTYRTKISGSETRESLKGSDVVLLAAGMVRKPGMRREELFEQNVGIIREAAEYLGKNASESVIIILTEPIDMLTTVFNGESGIHRRQIMGLGGLLDSTRLRYAIARDLGVCADDVSALVIGQHGEHMIGLPRYCTVSGIPVLNLMLPEQFDSLMGETRRAGDFIVELAKRASAYYAPSAAAAELVDAIYRDTKRVLPVSMLLNGEYGVVGVSLSIPVVVGRGGIVKTLLPDLTDEELERFQESAHEMKDKIAGAEHE